MVHCSPSCRFDPGLPHGKNFLSVRSPPGWKIGRIFKKQFSMKTAVTETSIQAYHTLNNKKTDVERVARLILSRTEAGQRTWDRVIFKEIGMLPSTVAARRNDLENMGTIELDGKKYRLQYSGQAKDLETRKTVNTYALVLANTTPQLSLF